METRVERTRDDSKTREQSHVLSFWGQEGEREVDSLFNNKLKWGETALSSVLASFSLEEKDTQQKGREKNECERQKDCNIQTWKTTNEREKKVKKRPNHRSHFCWEREKCSMLYGGNRTRRELTSRARWLQVEEKRYKTISKKTVERTVLRTVLFPFCSCSAFWSSSSSSSFPPPASSLSLQSFSFCICLVSCHFSTQVKCLCLTRP